MMPFILRWNLSTITSKVKICKFLNSRIMDSSQMLNFVPKLVFSVCQATINEVVLAMFLFSENWICFCMTKSLSNPPLWQKAHPLKIFKGFSISSGFPTIRFLSIFKATNRTHIGHFHHNLHPILLRTLAAFVWYIFPVWPRPKMHLLSANISSYLATVIFRRFSMNILSSRLS